MYIAGWSSQVARRAHNPEVVGSNPTPATRKSGQKGHNGIHGIYDEGAHIAQEAERRLGKAEVTGSNPVVSSTIFYLYLQ